MKDLKLLNRITRNHKDLQAITSYPLVRFLRLLVRYKELQVRFLIMSSEICGTQVPDVRIRTHDVAAYETAGER